MKKKLKIFLAAVLCMTLVLQVALPAWGFSEGEEDFSGTEINLSENLSDGEQQEAIPETPDSNTEDSEDQGEITVDPEETRKKILRQRKRIFL